MSLARKTLINVNDVLGPIQLIDPNDRNAAGTAQMFSGGGTCVIEVTNDDAILPNQQINATAVWQAFTDLKDTTGTAATTLTAALGAVRFELVGWRFVRLRESVKAGANNDVALNVRTN